MLRASGSCDRASLTWEKKEPTGDTGTDVYYVESGHELSARVHSVPVPTPHNRSQHVQANTTRGFIQSALLTMGIMMPESC